MIFQYPVVSLAVSIASNITQAAKVYCIESSKPYFAHLWVRDCAMNVAFTGFANFKSVKFDYQCLSCSSCYDRTQIRDAAQKRAAPSQTHGKVVGV